jgi:hypothetical protein
MSFQSPTPDEKLIEIDGVRWLVCAHCGVRIANGPRGFTTYVHADGCPMGESEGQR